MNTAFDSLTHKMQRAALGKTVDLVLSHAEKDPAKTVGQIVDLSKQFYGDSFSESRQKNPHFIMRSHFFPVWQVDMHLFHLLQDQFLWQTHSV